MKSLVLSMILSLACGTLRANTYGFLPGKKLQVSMKTAFEVFERHAKAVTGSDFNPLSALVMGDSKPGAGAWHFMQSDKDGKIYRFVLYFPEDLCVVLDESKGQEFLGAFTRDGKSVDRKTAGWEPMKPEEDPFAKPSVPGNGDTK